MCVCFCVPYLNELLAGVVLADEHVLAVSPARERDEHASAAYLVRVDGQDAAQAVLDDLDDVEARMERSEDVRARLERNLEHVAHHLAETAVARDTRGHQGARTAARYVALDDVGRVLAERADHAHVVYAQEAAAGQGQIEHCSLLLLLLIY